MTEDGLKLGNPNATLSDEWKKASYATAYWVVNDKPLYSFLNAIIDSSALPDTASDTAQENAQNKEGWVITWSSQEPCIENNAKKNFQVILTGSCVPD